MARWWYASYRVTRDHIAIAIYYSVLTTLITQQCDFRSAIAAVAVSSMRRVGKVNVDT